jgi:hypothetical protein
LLAGSGNAERWVRRDTRAGEPVDPAHPNRAPPEGELSL